MSDFDFMSEGKTKREEGLVVSLSQNISKSYINQIVDKIYLTVENGEKDALEIYVQAKALEELAKSILSKAKDDAIRDAERYGNGGKIMDVEFLVKGTADRYSFDHYEGWVKITEDINSLNERRKRVEVNMITAMRFGELTTDDGEVIPPAKIKDYGLDTIQIKIPK